MSYVSSITIENSEAFESKGSDVTIISGPIIESKGSYVTILPEPIIEYEEISRESIPLNWDDIINRTYYNDYTPRLADFCYRGFELIMGRPAICAYRCSRNDDDEMIINPIINKDSYHSGDSYVMPEPQLIVLPQLIEVTEINMPNPWGINFFGTSSVDTQESTGNSYIMPDSSQIFLTTPIPV